MYYPLKQDEVYCIATDFLVEPVWALTWGDVVSFVKKWPGRSIGIDTWNLKTGGTPLHVGANIILGIKDDRGENFTMERFGGWFEICDEEEEKDSEPWEEKLRSLTKEVRALHPGEEWVSRWYQNIKTSIKKDKGLILPENRIIEIQSIFEREGVSELVHGSFIWSETPEGIEYWKDMYDKLRKKKH